MVIKVLLTDPALPFQCTDLEDAASTLECLRANVELNRATVGGRAQAAALRWGNPEHLAAVAQHGPFDLIIGCERVVTLAAHHHVHLIVVFKPCKLVFG